MKKVKLPPNFPSPRPNSKIVSVRVSVNHLEKWQELQCQDESRIRPSDLMEYMIDYFHEEIFGRQNNDR
jgi:hypothetical protein